MTSTAPPSRLWRYPAPTLLLTAVVLFCFPWIEVWNSGICPPTPDVHQSGLDALCGRFSPPGYFGDEENGVRVSMLMGLYLFWLLLGLGVGFLSPIAAQRVQFVGLTAMAAVGLLVAQTLIGFPLVRMIDERNAMARAAEAGVIHYTLWFSLTWAATLSALVMAGAEWTRCYRRAAPAPKAAGAREAASGEEGGEKTS